MSVSSQTRRSDAHGGHANRLPLDSPGRARVLDAMVCMVYEEGFSSISVTAVCARSKVSRRTFYAMFDGLEDCFLAVIDEGYRITSELISEAFAGTRRWQDGVRDALAGLLSFFEAEPRIARVWLIETLAAGAWALERRERHVRALTELIVGYWPPPPGAESHPLAIPGAMASVLNVVQARVLEGREEPLVKLLGPLMGLACAPYLDAAEVGAEMARAEALADEMLSRDPPLVTRGAGRHRAAGTLRPSEASDPSSAAQAPKGRRAWQCVRFLARHAEASNREVASAIGVTSHTQISMLLARLARDGLLVKRPGAPGYPNAWSLSPAGRRLARASDQQAGREYESQLGDAAEIEV